MAPAVDTPRLALTKLLTSLFTSTELRIFMDSLSDRNLTTRLPEGDTTPEQLAHAAASLLQRDNLVTQALLAMEVERPHSAAQIDGVRRHYGSVPPTPVATGRGNAAVDELIGYLEDIARQALATMERRGEDAVIRSAMEDFAALHRAHVDQLANSHFIRAHETLKRIVALQQRLEQYFGGGDRLPLALTPIARFDRLDPTRAFADYAGIDLTTWTASSIGKQTVRHYNALLLFFRQRRPS